MLQLNSEEPPGIRQPGAPKEQASSLVKLSGPGQRGRLFRILRMGSNPYDVLERQK